MFQFLIGITVGIVLTGVAVAILFIWRTSPVIYTVKSTAELRRYIQVWCRAVANRGRIVVRSTSGPAEFVIFKRAFESKPDTATFRYRYTHKTHNFFSRVAEALSVANADYSIEHTRKRSKPRAIVIETEFEDIHGAQGLTSACEIAAKAIYGTDHHEYQVYCEGDLDPRAQMEPGEFIPWTQSMAIGSRVGRLLGRLQRWLRAAA